MSESHVIHALYHTMYRLMILRDVEHLAELLDDSFVLVHMTGRCQGKEEFLHCVADGTLAYYDEIEESVTAHVEPDGLHATLTGRSLVEASPFGIRRSTWRLQQDIDFVRRDGRWLMVEARASSY